MIWVLSLQTTDCNIAIVVAVSTKGSGGITAKTLACEKEQQIAAEHLGSIPSFLCCVAGCTSYHQQTCQGHLLLTTLSCSSICTHNVKFVHLVQPETQTDTLGPRLGLVLSV